MVPALLHLSLRIAIPELGTDKDDCDLYHRGQPSRNDLPGVEIPGRRAVCLIYDAQDLDDGILVSAYASSPRLRRPRPGQMYHQGVAQESAVTFFLALVASI